MARINRENKRSTTLTSLADVAKRANVSATTASFVLNGRHAEWHISDTTRDRVIDAARELGYRRNEVARSMARGKNMVIGYVYSPAIEELDDLFLKGILDVAGKADYFVKILGYNWEAEWEALANQAVEQRLSGVIMRTFGYSETTRKFGDLLSSYSMPVVFMDDDVSVPGTTCVTSDDAQGYRLAIEHLVQLGHRRIAHIAGDSFHLQSINRTRSFWHITEEHGISVPGEWVLDHIWNEDKAAEVTREIFRDPDNRPTALFCAGDYAAAIAIRTLTELGLNVPRDVSVVGYSDFTVARLLTPALTTVTQPFIEIGRLAAEILLRGDRGTSEGSGSVITLPTRLAVRSSTCEPPTR